MDEKEMKCAADGIEDQIQVLSDDNEIRFNERLNDLISDGWKIVQSISITPVRKSVKYGGDKLTYTAVLAKARQ